LAQDSADHTSAESAIGLRDRSERTRSLDDGGRILSKYCQGWEVVLRQKRHLSRLEQKSRDPRLPYEIGSGGILSRDVWLFSAGVLQKMLGFGRFT